MISTVLSIASFVLSLVAVVLAYFALVFVEDDTDCTGNWDSNEGHECENSPARSHLTPEEKADMFKRIAADMRKERNDVN